MVTDHGGVNLHLGSVDLGGFGQLLQAGVDAGTAERFLKLGRDLFEGRQRLFAGLVQENNVPAELRLYRGRDATNLKREHGFFKLGHHHASTEPTQRATIGAGRPDGVLGGEFREIRTFGELVDNGLRLFLGFQKDVGGIVFNGRLGRAVDGVIFCLKLFFGQFGHGDIVHVHGGEEGASLILEAQLHLAADFGRLGRFGENLLLDQLLQHAVKEHLIGQGLVFGGQHLAHRDQVADGDRLTIDGRQHGLPIHMAVGKSRGGQGERHGAGHQKAFHRENPCWGQSRETAGSPYVDYHRADPYLADGFISGPWPLAEDVDRRDGPNNPRHPHDMFRCDGPPKRGPRRG